MSNAQTDITEGPIRKRTVVNGIFKVLGFNAVGCFTQGHQNVLKKCSHQSPTDLAKYIEEQVSKFHSRSYKGSFVCLMTIFQSKEEVRGSNFLKKVI